MSTTLTTGTQQPTQTPATEVKRRRNVHRAGGQRPNWIGGLLGWIWLAIVVIPIYWIIITSFKDQTKYFTSNPMVPSTDPSLVNYRLVIESDFAQYFLNSVVVAIGAVVPAVLFSFMAAYAIVRNSHASRLLRSINSLFLMGLAIPLQATIIP